MTCKSCAERRRAARDALLRAAMGVKNFVSPKRTKIPGTAGKRTRKGKSEQETSQ